MQTNQYDYDTRATWMPPQNQPYNGRYVTSPEGRPQYAPKAQPQYPAQIQRTAVQKPKAPPKMPKERAMALADRLKRGFAIASILGFGTISGLVAYHQIGATTIQSTQSSSGSSSSNSSSSSSSSNSSNSSNSSSSTNSSSQSSNGFLNQQGGNTSGTSSSSSGSSSTSSNSSSTVSGTHTS